MGRNGEPCILIPLRQRLYQHGVGFKGSFRAGLCCGTVANAWDQYVMPERWITRTDRRISVIGDRSVAKQAREKGQRVIGQRRINERLLPVESFRRATAWQTISVQ